MLKLYSAPRTRSIRVAWLLEEMQQPYEMISGEFQQTGSRFFIQATPTGKYPTIDDDGVIMMESGAIIEYLLDKHGERGLRPSRGSALHAEYLQWLHYADATAFAPLGVVVWLTIYRDDADSNPQLIQDAKTRVGAAFSPLEDALSHRSYLLGDEFSAADIMMAFTLTAANKLGMLEGQRALLRYLNLLIQRPAFQEAARKTGNLDFVSRK